MIIFFFKVMIIVVHLVSVSHGLMAHSLGGILLTDTTAKLSIQVFFETFFVQLPPSVHQRGVCQQGPGCRSITIRAFAR